MKLFAILSSAPFESELILSQLKNTRKTKIAGKTIFKGKLSNLNILLMNTGIGKVNAAHSATAIIEHFPIRCIINSGIGGAYPRSGLKVGDIAVALKEIYGDDGVITPKGWEGIKEIGIPLVQIGRKKYFNEFPLNPPLSPFSKGGMGGVEKRDFRVKSGSFVTVSATTGTHKRAVELERRFDAICENMEGAAVAQVCTIYKIPMLEVRGISNIAGVRDRRKWDLSLASENCQKAVLEIINLNVA